MNPLGIDQRRIIVAAAAGGQLLGMGQLVPIAPGASEVRSVVVCKEARCGGGRQGGLQGLASESDAIAGCGLREALAACGRL